MCAKAGEFKIYYTNCTPKRASEKCARKIRSAKMHPKKVIRKLHFSWKKRIYLEILKKESSLGKKQTTERRQTSFPVIFPSHVFVGIPMAKHGPPARVTKKRASRFTNERFFRFTFDFR